MHTVSTFWNASEGEESDKDEFADLQYKKRDFTAFLQVKASGKKQEDGVSFSSGKGPAKVEMTFPFLTNALAIQRGKTLRAQAAPSQSPVKG